MSEIEVVSLCDDLIPEAAHLLSRYVNPDDTEGTKDENCRQVLKRFLANAWAHFWVTRIEGRCAGFISLAWSVSTSTGLPVLRVEGLYTLPGYRRRGVATVLLNQAAELARSRGANRLQLETDTDNPARRLYERLGFEWFQSKEVYMRFL